MDGALDLALKSYLRRVQLTFRECREQSRVQEYNGLRVFVGEHHLMRDVVETMERTQEFHELSGLTAREFHRNEPHLTIEGIWDGLAGNYLRLSGLYQAVYEGADVDFETATHNYRCAFEAKVNVVTHIAPLEFVEFDRDRLDCGTFEIRRFTNDDIGALFKRRTCEIFYGTKFADISKLSDYWCLCAKETLSSEDLIDPPVFAGVDIDGRINPSYSPYPFAGERALEHLSLYYWGSNPLGWSEPSETFPLKYKDEDFPFQPHIPFVISVSDSLLIRPPSAPDLSLLVEEPVFDNRTGEEVGWDRVRGLSLGTEETERFLAFMQHLSALLSTVRGFSGQWPFMEAALKFLVKAFTSTADFERLLWEITAIEAVLGQRMETGLTKHLKRRVSKILGQSQDQRKKIAKRFDELYGYRSDLVHGNTSLADSKVYRGHVCEAHAFAASIVRWALHLLSHVVSAQREDHTDLPRRDDLLSILDMEESSRSGIEGVLRVLPTSFPNVPGWLRLTGPAVDQAKS